MNKHLHRIVFNAARGTRMVVQETARSAGKCASGATPMVATLCAALFALPASAQIHADPNAPGTQRPTVLAAPNGVSLINVQTPTAAGVSRNTYRQFDVIREGAILNNSRTSVQTQQGGWVQGNPWLARGPARIILNEVNSTNPSQLRGYVEVAGQRAEVIIANPAGIQVNGGGFINASRATLTTGTPQFNAAGSLESFLVRGGTVSVEGAGLDASQTDYAAILARAVQVNAGFWASDLKVVAGANQVAADASSATPTTGSGAAPAFALDVAQLGGMYAGKITLVGTEAGVGMRNAGSIGAGAGGLIVTAAGRLENVGTLEGARIELASAGDIDNRGGTIRQTGSAALGIQTPTLTNTRGGVIGAEPLPAPEPGSGGSTPAPAPAPAPSLTPEPSSPPAGGTGPETGAAVTPAPSAPPAPGAITAAGTLYNDGGRIYAGGPISVQAPNIDNSGGSLSVTDLAVSGPQFSNAGGTLNVAGAFSAQVDAFANAGGKLQAGAIDIASTGNLDNQGGTLASSGGTTLVVGANLLNDAGTVSSAGALGATVGADTANTGGLIVANQRLQLSTRNLNNGAQGTIQSAGDALQLTVAQHLTNAAGASLGAAGNLDVQAGALANSGTLRAGQDGRITVAGLLRNDGAITSARQTTITADSLQSSATGVLGAGVKADGSLGTEGALDIATTHALAAHGTQLAAGAMALQGASIDLSDSQSSAAAIRASATQGDIVTRRANVVTPGTLSLSAQAQPGQSLINEAGQLNAGLLDVQVGNIVNTQGASITQSGSQASRLAVAGHIDNSAGTITSNAALALEAASLNNDAGSITSTASLDVDTHAGAVSNVAGTLAANDRVSVLAAGLDNSHGSIGAVAGELRVDTQGTTNNSAGKLLAGGALTLATTGLSNADGQITGHSVDVDTRGGQLDNTRATLGSTGGNVTLRTGALTNDAGLIQSAGDMVLDTQGQQLLNRNSATYVSPAGQAGAGGIASAGTLDLRSGALDNSAGYIGAKGDLNASTAAVTNANAGVLVSQGALSVDTHGNTFDNRGGQTQAVGDLRIAALSIDNSAGLIRSAARTTLEAASVLNRDTQGSEQGIEGTDILVQGASVDNTRGAIRADGNATLSASAIVDNSSGLISAVKDLRIADSAGAQGAKALQVINTGGTLVADQDLAIDAAGLTSDGITTAGRDLGIALTQDVVNNVDVSAGGNLSYTTSANFTNNAKLTAGATLTVAGANVDNSATGEMSGADTVVEAAGTLDNRGLIDSAGHTQLKAGTLNNTGSGRIYGDSISIGANTLNNTAESVDGVTQGGSIASRAGDVDIGVQQLLNDEALISSGRDLRIGGELDADGQATGRAQQVSNIAATIESVGNMVLGAQQLDNLNRGFSAREETTDQVKDEHYIASQPTGQRYTVDELGQCHMCAADRDDGGYDWLERLEYVAPSTQYPFEKGYARKPYQLPANGGSYAANDPVWALFDVPPGDTAALTPKLQAYNADFMARAWRSYAQITVTSTETTQTVVADAGHASRITSGGDMTLDIGAGRNTNSQVIAGGALKGNVDGLVNTETTGKRTVVDKGSYHQDWVEYDPYELNQGQYGSGPYEKAVETGSIDLSTSVKLPGTAPGSVGAKPDAANLGAASANAGASGAANGGTRPGTIFEVPSNVAAGSQGDGASGTKASASAPGVVRTTSPNASLPTASLFGVAPGGRYLVETDPRFANYRAWLSSDYLLSNLGLDPNTTQKRLGDGFYEQRLIREQVAQLTGQRWLGDYRSDEEQYTTLMNNGATFAQQYGLRPGVGLTAAQMAQLTSDIVWLVEQSVTLSDGSVQRVLVPQLYVRVRQGDIDGSGALLAGDSVDLKFKGDLRNEGGTIAARHALKLDADNIHNLAGGRITGQDVTLTATSDLNNIGATIDAGNSLSARAGRDLNVQSTTASASRQVGGSSSSLTQIDRVAGLYVTGGTGTLVASAGRDVNLVGAVIANAGTGATGVSAGRDINLGTVTESRSDNYVASSKQYSKLSQSQEVGSAILGKGGVTLWAGNDIKARAAQVGSSQGTTLLKAGNDIRLEAGRAVREQESMAQGTEKSLLKKKVTTVYSTSSSDQAIGTTISGKDVIMRADHDLTTQGANLQSQDRMMLSAGNNLNIGAAEESTRQEQAQRVQKSATGLAKTLGAGLAAGGVLDGAAMLNSKSDLQEHSSSQEYSTRGTTISAGSVVTYSGGDTRVEGSTIVADRDITMASMGNLDIVSAQGSYSAHNTQSSRQSGLVGKITQPSLGSIKQNSTEDVSGTTQTGSQVASLGGNISLRAGGTYRQSGSDVLALSKGEDGLGGNIDIHAKNVVIEESTSTSVQRNHSDSKSTVLGGSASVAGMRVDGTKSIRENVQSIQDNFQATGQASDSRMKALGAATTALQVKGMADAVQAVAAGGGSYKVSVNLSHNKSQSDSTISTSQSTGSKVSGAGNVSVSATGAGQDSNIVVRGSNINSGATTRLKADNAIELQASEDRAQSQGSNSSSGQSVGVGFAGGSQNGFTIELGASRGKGMQDGSQTLYNNTHVSGEKVVIDSGGDTVLRGAVVDAQSIQADIGGNLKIESLQDTVTSTAKQSSAGVNLSLCIPPICYGVSTVSGSAAKAGADVDYAAVNEQSGLKARDGGFDVNVKGKTELVGAVISSTQQAIDEGSNHFSSAGGVSSTDIQNHSDHGAKGYSLSGGLNFVAGDQSEAAMADKSAAQKKSAEAARESTGTMGKSVGWGSASGSETSVTRSGISGVAVEAGDTGVRTGDVQAKLEGPKDTAQLIREVQGQVQITGSTTREIMVHTDAAYDTLFKKEVKFYKVSCGGTREECLADPKKVVMVPISKEEAKRDGSILVVNGILNEKDRAGQLAYQNAPTTQGESGHAEKPESLTLMHIAPSATTVGELLAAGYEKMLAPTMGYSNADKTYADVLEGRGDQETLSLGHSRGTIVQTNGNNIAADDGYRNQFLTVMGVGGAVSQEAYRDAAERITKNPEGANFTYMSNDPVSVIAAGNPGDALAAFKEFFKVLSTDISAHSCYGTGSPGCSTIANPVPGGPVPTNQRPDSVMNYQGGVLQNQQGER